MDYPYKVVCLEEIRPHWPQRTRFVYSAIHLLSTLRLICIEGRRGRGGQADHTGSARARGWPQPHAPAHVLPRSPRTYPQTSFIAIVRVDRSLPHRVEMLSLSTCTHRECNKRLGIRIDCCHCHWTDNLGTNQLDITYCPLESNWAYDYASIINTHFNVSSWKTPHVSDISVITAASAKAPAQTPDNLPWPCAVSALPDRPSARAFYGRIS